MGPGRITWVLGCTFSTILLCVQHSGAQFLAVGLGRRIELCKLGWLVLLWKRPEYDSFACLLLCLASYFAFFVFRFSLFVFFLHHGMFILFVSLRLCSSHLLLSASTYYIVRALSAYVICTLPHLVFCFFFNDTATTEIYTE